MQGGEVIRRARTRAGLSIEELADRLAMPAEKVLAWERGDPPFSVVEQVAEACETEVARILREPEPDPHDVSLLESTLRMTMDERLTSLKNYARFIAAGRAALAGGG